MRISVLDSRQLLLVVTAMRGLDREARKHIRRVTKPVVQKEWQWGLAQRAETRLEHRVLVDTARVAVSDQNVTLKSAGSTRELTGGLAPSWGWAGVEYGADLKPSTYTRWTKRGRAVKITRTSGHQFKHRAKSGHVVFPTAADLIPRLASLWVQTWVRAFHDATEGK